MDQGDWVYAENVDFDDDDTAGFSSCHLPQSGKRRSPAFSPVAANYPEEVLYTAEYESRRRRPTAVAAAYAYNMAGCFGSFIINVVRFLVILLWLIHWIVSNVIRGWASIGRFCFWVVGRSQQSAYPSHRSLHNLGDSHIGVYPLPPICLNILLCGLPRAGKTTLLYRMKLDTFIPTIPTVDTITEKFYFTLGHGIHQQINVKIIDVGRRDSDAPAWRKDELMATDCVVFVINSTDRRCIADSKNDLFEVMFEDHYRLVDGRFLIFANKQEIPGALSRKEVETLLALPNELRDRWRVVASSAVTGQGIFEGLRWLASTSAFGAQIKDWDSQTSMAATPLISTPCYGCQTVSLRTQTSPSNGPLIELTSGVGRSTLQNCKWPNTSVTTTQTVTCDNENDDYNCLSQRTDGNTGEYGKDFRPVHNGRVNIRCQANTIGKCRSGVS